MSDSIFELIGGIILGAAVMAFATWAGGSWGADDIHRCHKLPEWCSVENPRLHKILTEIAND